MLGGMAGLMQPADWQVQPSVLSVERLAALPRLCLSQWLLPCIHTSLELVIAQPSMHVQAGGMPGSAKQAWYLSCMTLTCLVIC